MIPIPATVSKDNVIAIKSILFLNSLNSQNLKALSGRDFFEAKSGKKYRRYEIGRYDYRSQ